MANIPVGLIGCGGRGRGHVRALHALADVELVAVCDPVAASREQVGDEWGVERRYADVEAMLDAEELAAVIVATPAHLNAEAALPCLERGIDTLLEKPPGMSLDQTRALKEAAEASGARGMVGWNRRFDPLVLQVREEIESRGPIYQLVGEFHKSMSGFIAGGRFPEIVMDNMLLESPIHAIDLVRHLGGAPVAEVHSFVRRASAYKDVHAALVVFENDCVAQICANYTTDARLERYEIHGRDISAYIEGISTCELVCDGEHKHLQKEGTDSTLAQAAHFFDCIKAGRPIGPPAADLDEAIATMELSTAILAGLRDDS
ncbi:MAG: Gfo/Idh/MocA family oxidoreductase [Gemmatimonadetes bacterium]|nr:Gfo/Idh/MocA family oxidoreductase [Gemmatimonadota bacterium]